MGGHQVTLREMQRLVKNKSLDYRALDRLVESDQFTRAFERADAIARSALEAFLNTGNISAVRNWMRQQMAGVIEDQSVRQLRDLAKKMGVSYYHHLSKDELIAALKEKP